ncbi:MAG: putative transport system permease protein [Bacteroidales bacterium]|jgi:putative ABC transport system permease protein|nr:putative transport system permease protein [Bacteroidales bacterium]MDN5328219.1 putative transport system permease protein [Bacteroidales bacterium]
MLIILKLIRESYLMAFHEISVNKTRTFLTLLGLTIGIFCVISVLSVFDSMERKIRTSIESLGDNVVYVQKWPWLFTNNYPWWKFINRPVPTLDELKMIEQRSMAAGAVAYVSGTSRTVKSDKKSLKNVTVYAVSHDYDKLRNFELEDGRYFSPGESASGRNVAILGKEVADNLFEGEPAVGKVVRIYGRKAEVIGVFKKEGNNLGESLDQQVMVPILFAKNLLDVDRDGAILAKSREGISKQELIDELTGIMRSIRKLRPGEEDNFSINEISVISNKFGEFFNVLAIIGWVVGGFSLLVGGFGIANIMFVSVKERTNLIGIQKALGAKNYFILLQFLFEAVFLALLGGLLGLIFVFLMTIVARYGADFELILSAGNIMLGVIVSVVIGLVAGIIPSYSAARLDPVEAMRSTF